MKKILFQAWFLFTISTFATLAAVLWLLYAVGTHHEAIPGVREAVITTYPPAFIIVMGLVYLKLKSDYLFIPKAYYLAFFGGLFYTTGTLLWRYFENI